MGLKLSLSAILFILFSAFLAVKNSELWSPAAVGGGYGFEEAETVPIGGGVGPESFAFDPSGEGPYTGISDGRIIKWLRNESRWIDFAVTSAFREGCEGPHDHHQTEEVCGRPLGLGFEEKSGELYVADAYMGLLVVGPQGGLTKRVATEAQGIPFRFTNSLDIDPRGTAVYFSDSTSLYQRRDYVSAILSGDKTGRLMKYDPQTKQVEVLLTNLSFPNGVSLSKNGDFLLLAETSNCRILKYWLKKPKAGQMEVFVNVPGFPDNIKRSPRGGFWVGIHGRKSGFLRLVFSYPWVGKALVKACPFSLMKAYGLVGKWRRSGGMGIRVSEEGEILQIVEDKDGRKWRSIAEVEERDGVLWIGSISTPFAGKLDLPLL